MLLLLIGSFAFICALLRFAKTPSGRKPRLLLRPWSATAQPSNGRHYKFNCATAVSLSGRIIRGAAMATYVLLAIVVGLVIYLFYAVINPEKF